MRHFVLRSWRDAQQSASDHIYLSPFSRLCRKTDHKPGGDKNDERTGAQTRPKRHLLAQKAMTCTRRAELAFEPVTDGMLIDPEDRHRGTLQNVARQSNCTA
jgi:hypothetical protein